ncbi:DoxX-like family protein [Bacillus dakarensis]|uniref:DoxX-like family protein n=1 Tax=Robertmurraya dakarensis TaxID=1926278 RepID=UPI000982274A|nr:DoxX-like family protein [Bacillus dakarensis]
MKQKPIYVEIEIESEMEDLWEATQEPHLHEQWDLRFSSITYLPKEVNEPQLFSYKTKIAPCLQIEGWGKSVGTHHGNNENRTSSLHFGTDQPYSIIREGKGYWQYRPNKETITFLTQYDYNVNFGFIGRLLDLILFRPLIGWGTALSFDVLKRWIERDEKPSTQYIRFVCTWLTSLLFFFIWVYHGLVPKLIYMHEQELNMVKSFLSVTDGFAYWLVFSIGVAEILFGVLWLLIRKKRALFLLQIILFPLLTIAAISSGPGMLSQPFNPLTFNVSLLALSIIGYLVSRDLPTAKSCKRKR